MKSKVMKKRIIFIILVLIALIQLSSLLADYFLFKK